MSGAMLQDFGGLGLRFGSEVAEVWLRWPSADKVGLCRPLV